MLIFLNSQTKSVSSAALLLGLSALLSRLLGLFRDRLLAGRFGAGEELDIYFAAFRIPDFVYGILIMGGISAIFLPVFAEMRQRQEVNGWKFVNDALTIIFVVLVLLCGVLALATPLLISWVAPGFTESHRALAVSLTRIMFLSPILLGVSSIFSGVLQYFHRFLAYALSPIFYNIGIIIGILFFVPLFGLQGLAYGVILGAFLHFSIQIPAVIQTGWRYQPVFSFKNLGIQKLFSLLPPRVLGTSAYHINLIALTAIGSALGAGAISVFNFSNNLQYIPIGLIGLSFATAVFPNLSKAAVEGGKELFWQQLSRSLRHTLFFVIPISILMILLRAQIVRVVLGWGEFGWEDTRLVAASLAVFAIGIFAASIVPILARAFFSLQDTKTPAVVALFSTGLNVGLAIFFVRQLAEVNFFRNILGLLLRISDLPNFSVVGLPLAVSIAVIFQCVLLVMVLCRKLEIIKLDEIGIAVGKMLFSGVSLALVTYLFLQLGGLLFDTRTFWGIFWQGALSGAMGFVTYIAIAFALKLPEARNVLAILRLSARSKVFCGDL